VIGPLLPRALYRRLRSLLWARLAVGLGALETPLVAGESPDMMASFAELVARQVSEELVDGRGVHLLQ